MHFINNDDTEFIKMEYAYYTIYSILTFKKISSVEQKRRELKEKLALLRNQT